MKNLFIINEDEKDRILNLHESATKRQYLSEQVVSNYDSKYDYKKEGNNYYYKVKGEDNWVLSKGDASTSIKNKVFKDNSKIKPSTKKYKFKLDPEVYTVAKDNTRVGNGREMKIPDIKKILNNVGPSKKSSLPLHIRAVWDYLMGRTEPFTSADLTKEEQKFVKQVALNNPNKGFNYNLWKSNGASNLPTAMSTGSTSEKERLKQSGGGDSLVNSPLAGQFMYFLGEVSPSNVKISPDKKKVTVYDNYDMNNSKIPKDKMIKDFAKQVGKFALGDATLYSVIRQTVGLKELAGYKGYPVNLDV
jgi:hypothetical protein